MTSLYGKRSYLFLLAGYRVYGNTNFNRLLAVYPRLCKVFEREQNKTISMVISCCVRGFITDVIVGGIDAFLKCINS